MRASLSKGVYVLAAMSVGCSDRFALLTGIDSTPSAIATSISLSAVAPTLSIGQTVQLSAVVRNAAGNALPDEPVTWSSSNVSIATVSAAGLVAAVASGTATVRALHGSVVANASVVVSASSPAPPPSTSGTTAASAAPPSVYLSTAMPESPAAGGTIIQVASGGDLQAAIDRAQPGDVIQLAPGASYTGNFVLRKKANPSAKWIVIRPDLTDAQMLPEGARVTPQIAGSLSLPRVLSPNSTGAITAAPGSNYYRLMGLEVTVAPTVTSSYGLIALGLNEATLADVPHDLVLDRLYVHGSAAMPLRRCVLLNSASSAVIDSYVSDCHDEGSDAQAIAGWGGPGPFKIVNNYLEGSGENVMFGGADPLIPGVVPSDIEIRRNHIAKPASWINGRWSIKNLLELKSAQRVMIEGNVFDGSWAQAQTGYAILMKSSNQSGACTWCVTQDVTFRFNVIRNVGAGFALAAAPNDPGYDAIPARRISITDNVVTNINSAPYYGEGRGFLVTGNLADLTIAHNTLVSPTSMFLYAGVGTDIFQRLNVRDNLSSGGTYGYGGDGYLGLTAWNFYVRDGVMVGNVLVMNDPGTTYPVGNFFPKDFGAVGFVDLTGGDLRLSTNSPFKGRASDGRDPGADMNGVQSKTEGVVLP